MRLGKVLGGTLLIALASILTPAGASAQPQYPPPTPTDSGDPGTAVCFGVVGEVGNDFVVGRVEYQGEIVVSGGEGCAAPNGDVDVFGESVRVKIGSFKAYEDGSFSQTYTLPASMRPGRHKIIGEIEGRGTIERPIIVIGNEVLGGTTGNNNNGSGNLPRTGTELLLYVLWALLLITVGTVLTLITWRWGRHLDPVRAFTSRFRTRAPAPRALPAPGIPFVDTSRFVPFRQAERAEAPRPQQTSRTERENITEWDIAHRSERPS